MVVLFQYTEVHQILNCFHLLAATVSPGHVCSQESLQKNFTVRARLSFIRLSLAVPRAT